MEQVVHRQFTSDHRVHHTAWRGLRHDVLAKEVEAVFDEQHSP